MPFNPTIHSTNDGLARGIAQGAQALAMGLQGYYQKQEEKKLNDQATATFQKYLGSNPDMAKSIGLQDTTDTKAIGAMIKSLGGPAKAMEFGASAMQMQEMQKKQQEQAAVKARMESMLRMSQNPTGPLSNANYAQMQDPEAAAAIKAYVFSGDPRMATEVYGEQMKQMAANAGRERAPGNAVDLKSYRSADANGRPIEVTIDQKTGKPVGQGPVNEAMRPVLSPEEEAAKAQLLGRTNSALKFNEGLLEAGTAASKSIHNFDAALSLLDRVKTGTGADTEMAIKKFGSALGIKTDGIKDYEQLQTLLGDAVMARVQQTKGSISNKEMEVFSQYSASAAKTPEGNKAIFNGLKRQALRDRDIAKMVQTMRRKGDNEVDIQNAVNDKLLESPVFNEDDVKAVTGVQAPGPVTIKSIKKIN